MLSNSSVTLNFHITMIVFPNSQSECLKGYKSLLFSSFVLSLSLSLSLSFSLSLPLSFCRSVIVSSSVKCQPNYLTTRVKNWRRNQYTSSIIDTKLTPRQSPQSPPRFEMKSSQVILRDLSNSEEWKMNIKV